MTSWASVSKSARVVAALARSGEAPKRRPSNQHSPLCARKGDKSLACTCGATARSKAGEERLVRELAFFGIVHGQHYQRDVETVGYIPGRKFRADFLFRSVRLVVEFQGWASGYGPHGGIQKAKADVEKRALEASLGWRSLPVTTGTVKSGEAIRLILAALAWRAS